MPNILGKLLFSFNDPLSATNLFLTNPSFKSQVKSAIKVLYISHEGDAMKGSTFSLLNLISSVKEKVTPIIIIPSDGLACEVFKTRGIEYYIVPFKFDFTDKKGLKRILNFIPRYLRDTYLNYIAIKQIVKIARFRGINIVHTNSAVIDFGQSVAKHLGVKHVWHLREFLTLDFGYTPVIGWKNFLKKINQSSTIICITKSVYNHYKLANNKNALVLFNAVRPSSKARIKKEKKNYILFCGVVSREKGIEEALHAFSIIYKKHPNIKLLIVGSYKENYYSCLKIIVSELKISAGVEFFGFQNNIDDLMYEAICLLMCSKNEALGRVTIEAMFNGCPVIGYASGGTNELIQNNETGFLYIKVDELAENVCFLISHPDISDKIIQKAQTFARDNFSEEQYSSKLMDIYQHLLQHHN